MESAAEPTGSPESCRHETPDERADRNWVDLLQEFRVVQTDVQILGGFLLTLPFQARFTELENHHRALYLALVVLAAACTALLLAPIALHRRVFGWQRKHRLVAVGHRLARVVLVLVGLLVIGSTALVFDVVLGGAWGLALALSTLALVVTCLVVIPRVAGGRTRRRRTTESAAATDEPVYVVGSGPPGQASRTPARSPSRVLMRKPVRRLSTSPGRGCPHRRPSPADAGRAGAGCSGRDWVPVGYGHL